MCDWLCWFLFGKGRKEVEYVVQVGVVVCGFGVELFGWCVGVIYL